MKRRGFFVGALALPSLAGATIALAEEGEFEQSGTEGESSTSSPTTSTNTTTSAPSTPAPSGNYPAAPTGGRRVTTWPELDAAARAAVPVIDATGLTAPRGAIWRGDGWNNCAIVGGTFNELELWKMRNVEFYDTRIRYDASGRVRKEIVLRINSSNGVRFYRPDIRDIRMVPRSVYGQGYAIWLQNCQNVGIYEQRIEGFALQIGLSYVSNAEVADGEMWHSSRDGFNISNSSGIKIYRNHLHDFHVKQPEHPDFIQVLGHRQRVDNLEIVGNTLDMGAGSAGQCMLLQNERISTIGHHRNWLIEDNYIVGGHAHGLRVVGVDGVKIRNNVIEAGKIDFTEPYNKNYYLALPHIDGNNDPSVIPCLQIIGNCRNVLSEGNVFTGKSRVMSTAWNGRRFRRPSKIPSTWTLRA